MREGHQDMSFEIVDALINDQHFAIEAGVGIGKSFGYLVPVLLYSERMHKPVIIATSTIALQEQLWRDVRMLMPLLGLNKMSSLQKDRVITSAISAQMNSYVIHKQPCRISSKRD